MAKTTAERQKEYRASRPFAGDNGERRISAYVSTRAALALHRLANSYGVTKRELLERLLIAEDEKVLKGLTLDSPEGRKYLGESD
jgi:DNA-binding Lrp family transcriptional regulator